MASVDGAKSKYSNKTTSERYNRGLDQFLEESNEDNFQDAWEAAVQNGDSYTGGVEDFLESSGGVPDANVSQDYDWETETLSADWEGELSDADESFESRTDEETADTWFEGYAEAYGVDE